MNTLPFRSPHAVLPLLRTAMFSLLATGLLGQAPGEPPRRRPNIVMVMADDLGWGDVAYNGNRKVKTPVMDQLAHDGVRLDRFYTAPVCTPTRASCMTGRSPNRYGTMWAGRYPLPTEEVTVANVLKAAGYRTGFFGKWHLGKMTPECDEGFPGPKRDPRSYSPPWQHGFDVCFATESAVPNYNPEVWDDDWNLNSTAKAANKYIMDRPLQYGEGTLVGKPLPKWPYGFWLGEHRRAPGPIAGDASQVIMDPALDFINSAAAQEAPFLAVIWFVTPHTPVAASPESRAAYDQLTMREQHWYGAISAMDAQIGRLRNTLRKLGIERDTLIWFCSDNGPSWVHELNSAGPFRGQKADVYEGGIRTPSIVSWPAGIEGGRVIKSAVSTLDFLPTFMAAAGVDRHVKLPVLDGENVLPVLQGTTQARQGMLYYDYPTRSASDTWKTGETRQFAVMDGDWKLVSVDSGKHFQLFNLGQDIGEKTDVAAQNPDRVQQLRAKLDGWEVQCAASLKGDDYHH
ncbi:MAG: Arylsulfatase [Verrucomicrobia bacterium]|nr:Arylsulfatase [Verrucomicrobiota bacterium]